MNWRTVLLVLGGAVMFAGAEWALWTDPDVSPAGALFATGFIFVLGGFLAWLWEATDV